MNVSIYLRTLCFWIGATLSVLPALSQLFQLVEPDSQIAAAIHQVSPDHIRATIERLASFQTRSTLSAQDSASIAAGHGIGAAREWIKSQFEAYSRDCGGCLEVKPTPSLNRPQSEFLLLLKLQMYTRY